MRKPQTPVEHIRVLDAQLLVNGERLARYRSQGNATSTLVQRGVVDRLLDQRLGLMRQRDAAAPVDRRA